MKFVCDSCRAQYMISDEKVGPNGVKVRCKKCSHIIVVKKAPPAEEANSETTIVMPAPAAGGELATSPGMAGGAGGGRLEDEIGQAFDTMFQSGGGAGGGGGASGGGLTDDGGDGDYQPTKVFAQEDLAKLAAESGQDGNLFQKKAGTNGSMNGHTAAAAAAAAAFDPNAVEWYVAINDEQVGPLDANKIKEKWDSGEVGPDTLVWKAGMADWGPLSGVNELAQLLSPSPKPRAKSKAAIAVQRDPEPDATVPGVKSELPWDKTHSEEPGGATDPRATMPPEDDGGGFGQEEPSWKPSAASALAALASEELGAMAKPEPAKTGAVATAAPRGGPADLPKSLLETMNLPDTGGVDATGLHPLPIKALEVTGELPLARPQKASAVRESTEVRIKKSTTRAVLLAVGGMALLLVAIVGGGFWFLSKRLGPQQEPSQVMIPGPSSKTLAERVPLPPPPPGTQPRANPPPQPAPAPAAQPLAAAPARKEEPKAEPKREEAKREEPKPERKGGGHREKRIARAERSAEAPPPEPVKKHKSSEDDLLSVGGGDVEKEFAQELDGPKQQVKETTAPGGAKKHIFIPGAPGEDVPDQLGQSDINETVAQKKSALIACLNQQKASDPNLHGTIKMHWQIQPSGAVRDVKCTTPEFESLPVAGCFAGVIKSMRFPKSKQGQPLEFPFRF